MKIEINRSYDRMGDPLTHPKFGKRGITYTLIANNEEEEKVVEEMLDSIIKSVYMSTEDIYKELGIEDSLAISYIYDILNSKFFKYRVPVFTYGKEGKQVEYFWKKEVVDEITGELKLLTDLTDESRVIKTGQMVLEEISKQIAEIKEQNRNPSEIEVSRFTSFILTKYAEKLTDTKQVTTISKIFGIPVKVDLDINDLEVRVTFSSYKLYSS